MMIRLPHREKRRGGWRGGEEVGESGSGEKYYFELLEALTVVVRGFSPITEHA
jgi:hypothetical protein